jgi:hypothetical protein
MIRTELGAMQTAHDAIAPLPDGIRRAVQWLVAKLGVDLGNCDLEIADEPLVALAESNCSPAEPPAWCCGHAGQP